MQRPKAFFSESWHRVAAERVRLRPTVDVRRQFYRGERWYVLHDPFSQQFYRMRPGAYGLVARLDGSRTVEEAWQQCLAEDPEEAPGQEEIIQLLGQLYQSNLIRADLPPEGVDLFRRFRKRRQRETRTKLASILFLRIPLFDPDALLKRTLWIFGWLFSVPGALLWLIAFGWACKLGVENWDRLWQQGQGLLAPGNLGWLYVGLTLAKVVHEFGHAYAVRRFGGEVHTMGVMLLVLTPLPYMDATASWGFRSRWQRFVVGAAGMYWELLLAAGAMFVWANTGPGPVNAVAFNLMFIASVSTILFNANPLLRFDGYYMLCDLLDMPNLHQRAGRMWRYISERHLFGCRRVEPPVKGRGLQSWLLTFGAMAWVYRIILFAGIILFVAGQWLFLGLALAVVGLVTWVVVPTVKITRYLGSSRTLDRNRPRAIAVVLGGITGLVLLLAVIPFPYAVSAPGVVWAERHGGVYAGVSGKVAAILAQPGSQVTQGQVLMRLELPELTMETRQVEADLAGAAAEELSLLIQPGQGLQAVRERIVALERRRQRLLELAGELELRAPIDGIWFAPMLDQAAGVWIERGTQVGEVIDPTEFRFTAVMPQRHADHLFSGAVRDARIRLRGQAVSPITTDNLRVLPARRDNLPSAALGWLGGGDIAVRQQAGEGTETVEGFFEVRANLGANGRDGGAIPDHIALAHGRSGRLLCRLPPEPLLQQAGRWLRQLLQQRLRGVV